MSRERTIGYVALALASAALALSIRASVRKPAASSKPAVCVDEEARGELERLRRAVALRDATTDRLRAGSAATADDPLAPPPAANDQSDAPADPQAKAMAARLPSLAASADRGPTRFVRFEIPNPAITITQKDDGLIDIRTTDPKLSGSVLTVTAVTASGEEQPMIVRVP